MALNHNLNVAGKFFHVQTEKVNREDHIFAVTQIFLDGRVVWSQKNLIKKDEPEYLKQSHKMAFFYLKSIVINNILINPQDLQIPFDKLKENAGISLLSGDIFNKNYMVSLAGYNRNRYASRLFKQIFFQTRKESIESENKDDIDYIFLMLSKKRGIIIGEVDNSDLIYALLINFDKLPFGLLVNVLLPEFIENITNIVLSRG